MRKALFVICLSVVAALVAAGPAAAGSKYADIKATAVCTLDSEGKILTVDVGYVFTSLNMTPPDIYLETVTLEKNIQVKNNPYWVKIADLYKGPPETSTTPYDVEVRLCPPTSRLWPEPSVNLTFDFSDANALRAVVELSLNNANPNGKTGDRFLARCVSFSPPSCK